MIDFTFTEEQEMFRKAAREFADTKLAPQVAEMEKTGEVSDTVVKALGEAEMMAITIPEEYGGLGLGYTERLIALEEISRISVATAMMLQVFALGIEPIVKFGSEEQKRKYLPGLASGERLATTAVTEATGGSDPTGIKSAYTKDGDTFIVNGRKCFITNSHLADTITILAKADDNPKAFCAFVIDKDMPGWKPTHKEHKVGMRGCNTGELSFEDLKIGPGQLLGEEGKGLRVTMAAIGDVGRGGMVGTALGLQAACLEESIKFANQRILYGKPISALQTIQNKISGDENRSGSGKIAGVQGRGHPGCRRPVQQRIRRSQILHHGSGSKSSQNSRGYTWWVWLHGRVSGIPFLAGRRRTGALGRYLGHHEGDHCPLGHVLID